MWRPGLQPSTRSCTATSPSRPTSPFEVGGPASPHMQTLDRVLHHFRVHKKACLLSGSMPAQGICAHTSSSSMHLGAHCTPFCPNPLT